MHTSKPGKEHANADLMSRLPLPETPREVPVPGETNLLLECLQTSPVNAKQIRIWTDQDHILSKVKAPGPARPAKYCGQQGAAVICVTQE